MGALMTVGWPNSDLCSTLDIPAATMYCLCLHNSYCALWTLRCLRWLHQGFAEMRHFPGLCILLWLLMCVCISNAEACSVVSLRSMGHRSLLILSKQCKAMAPWSQLLQIYIVSQSALLSLSKYCTGFLFLFVISLKYSVANYGWKWIL